MNTLDDDQCESSTKTGNYHKLVGRRLLESGTFFLSELDSDEPASNTEVCKNKCLGLFYLTLDNKTKQNVSDSNLEGDPLN